MECIVFCFVFKRTDSTPEGTTRGSCQDEASGAAGGLRQPLPVLPVVPGAGGLPVRALRRLHPLLAEGRGAVGRVE